MALIARTAAPERPSRTASRYMPAQIVSSAMGIGPDQMIAQQRAHELRHQVTGAVAAVAIAGSLDAVDGAHRTRVYSRRSTYRVEKASGLRSGMEMVRAWTVSIGPATPAFDELGGRSRIMCQYVPLVGTVRLSLFTRRLPIVSGLARVDPRRSTSVLGGQPLAPSTGWLDFVVQARHLPPQQRERDRAHADQSDR